MAASLRPEAPLSVIESGLFPSPHPLPLHLHVLHHRVAACTLEYPLVHLALTLHPLVPSIQLSHML